MTLEQQPVERPDIELRFRSPRIYLPAEFDKKLTADPAFKATIAGCTTLPLAWLRRDDENKQFTVDVYGANEDDPPTGHINMNVHQDIKRMLLTDPEKVIVDYFMLMWSDRSYMAFFTTVADLYRQQTGQQLDQDYGFGNLINLELKAMTDVYSQKRTQDLDKLLDDTLSSWPTSRPKDEMKREVRDAFPSDQAFFLFLDQIKDRRGVQVIYGGRQELLDFIQSQDFEHIDDNGIKIVQPIPDRLIVAVLPLGKYEQAELI